MRGRGAVNFAGDKSRGIPGEGGSGASSSGNVQTFGLGGGKVLEERVTRLEEIVNTDPGLLRRFGLVEEKIEHLEVSNLVKQMIYAVCEFKVLQLFHIFQSSRDSNAEGSITSRITQNERKVKKYTIIGVEIRTPFSTKTHASTEY